MNGKKKNANRVNQKCPVNPNLIIQATSCSQMNETMQNTSLVNPNLIIQATSYSRMNETKKSASPANQNSTEQSQSKSQICFPNQSPLSLLYEVYSYRNLNEKSQDHSKVPTVIIPSKYKRLYQ